MKKQILILGLMATSFITANAQLKVTSDGKVKVASDQTSSYSTLLVGNNQFVGSMANIGISGSTTVIGGKSNIGIMGTISANSSIYTPNYGVLGVVSPTNNMHGKNYGLCGMIGFNGEPYGGAGIYATNYHYLFTYPTNIQGIYAGYFFGAVNVTGNLTTPNVYIPSDSRLSENVVSLNERGRETSALDNLVGMNVIEYNMKSRISDEIAKGAEDDKTGEVREAFEYLKKDEMKMCSVRHFGIDAEELRKVYPDLVLEGQDGYLAVNYVELVPLLIRSIQELKQQVDELSGCSSRQARTTSYNGDDLKPMPSVQTGGNILYQNTPNPFHGQTTIRFSIADDATNASICIFDMTGKLLKKLPISSSLDSVTINGYELGEGIYLYSLMVNGQEIDTKRMILTK